MLFLSLPAMLLYLSPEHHNSYRAFPYQIDHKLVLLPIRLKTHGAVVESQKKDGIVTAINPSANKKKPLYRESFWYLPEAKTIDSHPYIYTMYNGNT
jgi:hypothetical protein